MSSIIWQPTAAQIDRAPATIFREEANNRFGLELADWDDLYAWSVLEPACDY